MKINNKTKHAILAALLLVIVIAVPVNHSFAETIPIPRKRPNVMSVSPAYIAELMGHGKISNVPEAEELNAILPSSLGDKDFIIDDEGYINSIENIDAEILLSTLSPDISYEFVPIPPRKPSLESADAKVITKFSGETALVSFVLKPNQIDLDPNLKQFLNEYAINMFKNDPDLNMKIQAYATPEGDKEYSDVRISLARALEVRSYLLSKNIDPSRLKLTAMGQDKDNKSDNRIDLLFVVSK